MTEKRELLFGHHLDMEDFEGARAAAAQAGQDSHEAAQPKSIKELLDESARRFEDQSTTFTYCLAPLAIAQDRAASEGPDLGVKDALSLGNALADAGHALYNGDRDGAGRQKFKEAAEMFSITIGKDPYSVQGHLGLSEMQAQLGWSIESMGSSDPYPNASKTMFMLEERLKERPDIDTADVRTDIAEQYARLQNSSLALESLAVAVGKSVEQPGSRLKILKGLHALFHRVEITPEMEKIERDDLTGLAQACRRALIQDPNDRIYLRLARSFGGYK